MALSPIGMGFMVPRGPAIAERIEQFYGAIGWSVEQPDDSPFDRLVRLALNGELLAVDDNPGNVPEVGYWQTENPKKLGSFVTCAVAEPSVYAIGPHLPTRDELHEFCMFTDSDDKVEALRLAGGQLLKAHTYAYGIHAGGREIRFEDPFGYTLRVTTHPAIRRRRMVAG